MPYRELIRDYSRIRPYLRSFYVYGFKHRGGFSEKSARSYDNERRRVESWLGEYMSFEIRGKYNTVYRRDGGACPHTD